MFIFWEREREREREIERERDNENENTEQLMSITNNSIYIKPSINTSIYIHLLKLWSRTSLYTTGYTVAGFKTILGYCNNKNKATWQVLI